MANQTQDDKAFTATTEAIKQLITVASGVLVITITFVKDLLQDDVGSWLRVTLLISWGAFVLSVVMGILGLGAIAGQLGSANPTIGSNVKVPAQLQFGSFLIGIVALSIFGGVAFWDFDPTTTDAAKPMASPTATVAPSVTSVLPAMATP